MAEPRPWATPTGRWGVLIRYAAMRSKIRLAYRADLALGGLGDLMAASVGALFLFAIYHHVPEIRGWTFSETLFTWGLAEAATGLLFCLFAGLWSLNQRYLLGGEMDRVLLRPVDPYLQILLDNFVLKDLPVAGLGIAMMALAAPGLPAWGPGRWALLLPALLGGVLVLAGVLTAVSAVGFRVHHRGTAIGLVYQSATFARYPLDLFDRRLQLLLTWVLPFGFIAFFPASWLVGREDWRTLALAQPLVGLGVFCGGLWIWKRALRGYRSTGS